MDRKILIFDFVYTLAFLKPSDEDIIYSFLKKKISKKRIKNTISTLSQKYFYSSIKNIDKNKRKNFYIKYHYDLLELLNVKEKIKKSELLFDIFEKKKRYWNINKKLRKQLFKLNTHFDLGIASNFDSNLKKYLIKNKINKLIKFMIISKKVGYEKPSRKFFQILKSKVKNKKSIYIGDNYKLDYLPASALNIKSYLIVNKMKKKFKYEITRHEVENKGIKFFESLFH